MLKCKECDVVMIVKEANGLAFCKNEACKEYGWTVPLPEKKDAVNPNHYKGDTTMVYLENVMTPEMVEGFLVGNVLKYVSRYHNKNGVEDLEKANWYLARLIKRK